MVNCGGCLEIMFFVYVGGGIVCDVGGGGGYGCWWLWLYFGFGGVFGCIF